MPQWIHIMLSLLLASLLAACSKSLPPSLMPAVMKADGKDVQTALRKGANANEKDSRGMTVLMIAAERGSLDVVQALLNKGADVHEKELRQGRTALILAVANGHAPVVRALLDKGADVKDKDNNGWTPLMIVAERGDTAITQALLARGPDVNEKEAKQGRTALHLATGNGHGAIVQALLAKDADVTEKDNNGWTALLIASELGRVQRDERRVCAIDSRTASAISMMGPAGIVPSRITHYRLIPERRKHHGNGLETIIERETAGCQAKNLGSSRMIDSIWRREPTQIFILSESCAGRKLQRLTPHGFACAPL
jgi:ankyrin repeat protein